MGNFVAVLLQILFQYLCATDYQNIMWCHKVIAKIKRVHFFAPQCSNELLILSVHSWLAVLTW